MKNTNKKGFTIVELVIVIAVIAILAAVLIPTFVGLVNKANVASDTALIKNLNTALAADTDGCKTMHEALEAAAAYGYDVAKINAKASKNEILWDSVNNVFCYFDSEKGEQGDITYIPDYNVATKPADVDYWVVASTPNEKYSTYLYEAEGEITANVGIDAGECEGITKIVYKTEATQSVVIRTNSSNTALEIDASNSDIKHYGAVGDLTITAVAANSYHENGVVSGMATITAGRIVVENNGNIPALKIKGENVKIVTSTNIAVSVDSEVNVDNIEIEATSSSVKIAVDENLKEKVEGGTTIEIVKVGTADELTEALEAKAPYILLTADIEADDTLFNVLHSCVIDGDGHTIKGNGGLRGSSTKTNIVINFNGTDKVDVELRNLSVINTRTEEAGRPLETRGNINSLTLLNVTLDTSVATSGYRQALTIGGNQAEKAKVVIKNSNFNTGVATGYAVIMFNPVDMTIDETTITGWSTLYFKGEDGSAGTDGSVVNVVNSALLSTNKNSGETNNFACVVFEDNNITLNIDSTEVLADEDGAANQTLFSFSYENYDEINKTPVKNNTVTVKGDATITYGELVYDHAGEATTNKIVLEGGTYMLQDSAEIAKYVASGYTVVTKGTGCTVTKN